MNLLKTFVKNKKDNFIDNNNVDKKFNPALREARSTKYEKSIHTEFMLETAVVLTVFFISERCYPQHRHAQQA